MDKIHDFCSTDSRMLSLENFEGEVWKDIQGYEGLYSVSNYGRVKSLLRKSSNYDQIVQEKIKRQVDNGHGYLEVNLYKNGKQKMKYVHRIVASAFIPNPFDFPQVNHKDENKSNNKVENLEWCTQNYNNKYGTGRFRSEQARINNGNTTQIDMYDLKGNFLKHYICSNDLEKDGLSRRAALNVCTGRNRSYKKCVFRFSGEPFGYRERDKKPNRCKKEVIKTDLNGNIICIYNSIKEAEKQNGLCRNYLYSATYASSRKALVNGCYLEIKKYNQ